MQRNADESSDYKISYHCKNGNGNGDAPDPYQLVKGDKVDSLDPICHDSEKLGKNEQKNKGKQRT